MRQPVVDGKAYEEITFQWREEVDQEMILRISSRWMSTRAYLTTIMDGLERVGESDLTIEPFEDQLYE